VKVLVTGGTGFVGPHVIHAIRAQGHDVRALVRKPGSKGARTLESWGCELAQGDMTDAESLRRAVEGCEAVVNLVAILLGKPEDFRRIMEQGNRALVAAAQEAGVTRFVLMSALGTVEAHDLAPYYAAKWDEEQAVGESGVDHVIFRPSFIFGRDGGILQPQIRMVRFSPVTPVLGRHKLQPIWVDDVAAFFAAALTNEAATNRTFDLAGPDRITWAELHAEIRRALGKRRLAFGIPAGLLKASASVGQLLPPFYGARAAVEMLDFGDNVGDPGPAVETFGIRPLDLRTQIRRAVS
jgi:NADH dehydrogenase